jgi:hypothetical protein
MSVMMVTDLNNGELNMTIQYTREISYSLQAFTTKTLEIILNNLIKHLKLISFQ